MVFALLVHALKGEGGGPSDKLAALAHGSQGLASFDIIDDFAGHSMLVNISVSPELLEKEKQKAKQGYCETALWNCNDLWGP